MKYVIVPIIKILSILMVILISPLRLAWNLFFSFKWIGWNEALSVDGESILDTNIKQWLSIDFINLIFSKQATDKFLND